MHFWWLHRRLLNPGNQREMLRGRRMCKHIPKNVPELLRCKHAVETQLPMLCPASGQGSRPCGGNRQLFPRTCSRCPEALQDAGRESLSVHRPLPAACLR